MQWIASSTHLSQCWPDTSISHPAAAVDCFRRDSQLSRWDSSNTSLTLSEQSESVIFSTQTLSRPTLSKGDICPPIWDKTTTHHLLHPNSRRSKDKQRPSRKFEVVDLAGCLLSHYSVEHSPEILWSDAKRPFVSSEFSQFVLERESDVDAILRLERGRKTTT